VAIVHSMVLLAAIVTDFESSYTSTQAHRLPSNPAASLSDPAIYDERPWGSYTVLDKGDGFQAVSYTHLTLPTICSV